MALVTSSAMDEWVAATERLMAEDPFGLSAATQLGNIETYLTQQNRLESFQSGLINAMWTSEATVETCGQSVKGFLVHDQHLSPGDAGARIRLARALLTHDQVAAALADGQISGDHAATIAATVDAFPAQDQEMVEKELTDAAKFTDPAALARACKDMRDHLGLNGSAEERYAKLYGSRHLKTSTTIDGMVKVDGMLDPETGAALKAAIASLSHRQGPDDDRTKPQRDHDALASIIGFALRTGDLPDTGGEPPQVVVTVSLADLTERLDAMHHPTRDEHGKPFAPGRIRMLACDAGIIPAVMRGASEILDLGRSSRTWTKAQRRAAKLRDGHTCTWPGQCTIPIRYCELHHIEFWIEHLGPSDHNNSAHLCNFHHWLVHNRPWTLWRDPDGTLQHRRT